MTKIYNYQNYNECDLKRKPWYKYITVEPPMFFYMMAFMITSVVEQTFYVYKACTVNHGYSSEICYNISSYKDINNEVQVTISTFHQWNGIAGHIVPVFLAFFLGSYSDKRGRKSILLAGLIGKLYFSFMITINTLKDWPVEYVIYTAAFPSAITGADLAIFAGCFAYIADVTSVKNRTLRVGILDVVYLSTMPTGVAIGNLLYNNVVNKSFTAMFTINTCLMVLATLYCLIFLKWQTRAEQKSLKEANVKNPITDFFDVNNIKQTVVTLTKKRHNKRRLFLWILLISMAFYTFQRDERPMMYLYTSNVFQWDTSDFSNFRTFLSSSYVLAMLFGIPIMTKLFKWRDTVIVMIGATAHICGHFIYAHASVESLMYVGGAAAALGPCVAPLIRSMASKVLPTAERAMVVVDDEAAPANIQSQEIAVILALDSERADSHQPASTRRPVDTGSLDVDRSTVTPSQTETGVAYAFLSVMENAVAMFASIVYSQVYKATLDTPYVNSIFYFTMATQGAVLLLTITMEIMLRGKPLDNLVEAEENTIKKENEYS